MIVTLHVLTTAAPPRNRKHGYLCDCQPCLLEKMRPASVCHCDNPIADKDPSHCIRCGHPTAVARDMRAAA
jgi:hypothetical protein